MACLPSKKGEALGALGVAEDGHSALITRSSLSVAPYSVTTVPSLQIEENILLISSLTIGSTHGTEGTGCLIKFTI